MFLQKVNFHKAMRLLLAYVLISSVFSFQGNDEQLHLSRCTFVGDSNTLGVFSEHSCLEPSLEHSCPSLALSFDINYIRYWFNIMALYTYSTVDVGNLVSTFKQRNIIRYRRSLNGFTKQADPTASLMASMGQLLQTFGLDLKTVTLLSTSLFSIVMLIIDCVRNPKEKTLRVVALASMILNFITSIVLACGVEYPTDGLGELQQVIAASLTDEVEYSINDWLTYVNDKLASAWWDQYDQTVTDINNLLARLAQQHPSMRSFPLIERVPARVPAIVRVFHGQNLLCECKKCALCVTKEEVVYGNHRFAMSYRFYGSDILLGAMALQDYPEKDRPGIIAVVHSCFGPGARLDGSTKQLNEGTTNFVVSLLCRIVTVIAIIFTEKDVSVRKVVTAWKEAKIIGTEYGEIKETVAEILNGDPLQHVKRQMQDYINQMNMYAEKSYSYYSTRSHEITKLQVLMQEVETFISLMSRQHDINLSVISGLYAATNAYKNEIVRLHNACDSRQEPRIVLFMGEGCVGKTQSSKAMMRAIGDEFFPDQDASRRIIEITAGEKYWPAIGDQPLAFFDEAGKKNFNDDLLFRNVRGMCSTAKFDCQGALISQKDQPCRFKMIWATTNITPELLTERFAELDGKDALPSIYSRMLIYVCIRNPAYGEVDINNRENNRFDQSGKFDHVLYKPMRWSKVTQTLVYDCGTTESANIAQGRTLRYTDVLNVVRSKLADLTTEYLNTRANTELHGMTKQSGSKQHFVLNLHGKPYTGKGRAIDVIRPELANLLNYPILEITNETNIASIPIQEKPVICILDDWLPCDVQSRRKYELDYMNLYNNVLAPHSIIIIATNIIPRNYLACSLIPVKTEIWHLYFAFYWKKALAVNEAGSLRRMGFAGSFHANSGNADGISFTVDSDKYYMNQSIPEQYLVNAYWLFVPILLSLVLPWTVLVVGSSVFAAAAYVYLGIRLADPVYYRNNLFSLVFSRYQQYLKAHAKVKQVYGAISIPTKLDIGVRATDVSRFAQLNAGTVLNCLTFDQGVFEKSLSDCIIYMDPTIAQNVQTFAKRFVVKGAVVDHDFVVSYIVNFVHIFKTMNLDPNIYINLDSIGKYLYQSGTLYIDRRTGSRLNHTVHVSENNVVISSSEDGEQNVCLSWDSIFAYLDEGQPLVDIAENDVSLIHAITTHVKSPTVMGSPHFRNLYKAWRNKRDYQQAQMVMATVTQKFKDMMFTTKGKIILALLGVAALLTTSVVLHKIFSSPAPKSRKARVKQTISDSDSTDSEDELEIQKKKRKARLVGDPKNTSDMDKQRKKRKPAIGGSRRITSDIDDTSPKRQTVLTLNDVNDHDDFSATIGAAGKVCDKNLVQVYLYPSNDHVLTFPSKAQMNAQLDAHTLCYGLGIRNSYFVTVGHTLDSMKKNPKLSMYVASDEYGLKAYKCKLIATAQDRDISFWESGSKIEFKNIEKHLFDSWDDIPFEFETIIRRYAPGKREQFIAGSMEACKELITFTESTGERSSIKEYGFCDFGYITLAMTSYGDCGLPYFARIGNGVKIVGIHCMGNMKNQLSTGVSAIITASDIRHFLGSLEKESTKCSWCNIVEKSKTHYIDSPVAERSESSTHLVLWNQHHDATKPSFVQEIEQVFEYSPKFKGKIEKNLGPSSTGTQEHSHLHFIMDSPWKPQGKLGWKRVYVDHFKKEMLVCRKQFTSLKGLQIFLSAPWMEEFKCIMKVLDKKDGKHMDMELYLTKHSLSTEQEEELLTPTMQIPFKRQGMSCELDGEPVYAPETVLELYEKAVKNTELYMHDVPIASPPENQTVMLLGSFKSSQSHLPSGGYEDLVPIGMKLENPPGKAPFCTDVNRAPQEQFDQLVENNFGNKDQRVTQAVQWQRPGTNMDPCTVIAWKKEFSRGFKKRYETIQTMSDFEVFHGMKSSKKFAAGMAGLELNRSIGWTMSMLFNVKQKSDVINLDEKGVYSWKTTPAANFAHQWYREAVEACEAGVRVLSCYLELLKMEKLKHAKNFIGRIFCATDLIGILLQRKYLGHWVAQSTVANPVCGVGKNPWFLFPKMAKALIEKGHYFTLDYSRWDKTVPYAVQQNIMENICAIHEKPLAAKVVCAEMFNSIHVSGQTMFKVRGGQPSGCLPTANENSEANDSVIFYSYLRLAPAHFGHTWEDYEKHVYRMFYGDDVVIGVDEDLIKHFNMITISNILRRELGLACGSSEKDGMVVKEMQWHELSWCSRYFRKLVKRPMFVGALKKSTITSWLHYAKKPTTPEIVATQLMLAMYEAAAWEEEFYDSIVRDVKRIVKATGSLKQLVAFDSYLSLQEDMYFDALQGRLLRCAWEHAIDNKNDCINTNLYPIIIAKLAFQRKSNKNISLAKFFKRGLKYQDSLRRLQRNPENETMKDYVSMLNLAFQDGKITRPAYSYAQDPDLSWICIASAAKSGWCSRIQTGNGVGHSKQEAKNYAAMALWSNLFPEDRDNMISMSKYKHANWVRTLQDDGANTASSYLGTLVSNLFDSGNTDSGLRHRNNINQSNSISEPSCSGEDVDAKRARLDGSAKQCRLDGMTKQMNFSQDQVPVTLSTGKDVSLTAGSQVFTNTAIGEGRIELNATAFTLDNIAQSGAAFDIKDSVYNIYELQYDTSVSASQGRGAEVLRVSLDPKTLPDKIRSYVSMHEAIIPEYDFAMWVNGTAGALGTLKIGYVRDISKPAYDLTELQGISSADITLSQSSAVNFTIRDIRKNGLYRSVEDDPEPYPGVVVLVSSPVSNVQRNDAVNYAIQVYVRLSPKCMLAVPRALKNNDGVMSTIAMRNYLTEAAFDLVANTESITSEPTQTQSFPDCGYLTGTFNPVFSTAQIVGFSCYLGGNPSFIIATGTTLPTEGQINLWKSENPESHPDGCLVTQIGFAYGEVPDTGAGNVYRGMSDLTTLYADTLATIPEIKLTINEIEYSITQSAVFPKGTVLIAVSPFVYLDTVAGYCIYRIPTGGHLKGSIGAVKQGKPQGFVTYYDTPQVALGMPAGPNWTTVDIGSVSYASFVVKKSDVYPSPLALSDGRSPIYQMTWLFTGNNAPTAATPSGTVRLYFMRSGTSADIALPVNGVNVGGLAKLVSALQQEQERRGAEWLQLSFGVDEISLEFDMAFRNGIFLIKTAQTNVIRTGLQTSTAILRNVQVLGSPSQLRSANVSTWQNWIAGSKQYRNRLDGMRKQRANRLDGMQKQAAAAGMIIGKGIGSMAEMGYNIWQYQQAMQNAELNRQMSEKLMNLKNRSMIDLEKLRFQNVLQLKGLTSASAQSGNMSQETPSHLQTRPVGTTMGDSMENIAAMRNPGKVTPLGGSSLSRSRWHLPEDKPATAAAKFFPASEADQSEASTSGMHVNHPKADQDKAIRSMILDQEAEEGQKQHHIVDAEVEEPMHNNALPPASASVNTTNQDSTPIRWETVDYDLHRPLLNRQKFKPTKASAPASAVNTQMKRSYYTLTNIDSDSTDGDSVHSV